MFATNNDSGVSQYDDLFSTGTVLSTKVNGVANNDVNDTRESYKWKCGISEIAIWLESLVEISSLPLQNNTKHFVASVQRGSTEQILHVSAVK